MRDRSSSPIVMRAVPRIGNIRYRPVRLITCPDPIDTISNPAMSGRSCRPEMVGDSPRTIWKNSGR